MHVSFQISILLFFFFQIYTQEWNWLGHTVVLILVFWKTAMLFSTAAVPIYIPTKTVYKDSLFSTSSPVFVICVLFDDSPLTPVRWYINVFLTFISLMISDFEHLFMCLLVICISSLGKMSTQICSFFNWVVCFFDIELYELFIYFGY